MAACCCFRVDLRNALHHYSLSRFADGTPYSSSDLIYFTLLLPFFEKIILSQTSFSFSPFWTKNLLCPNFSSLFSLDKNVLSQASISQNYSKTRRFLGKENWRYIDQISPRLRPWCLEFILISEIRIKNAENVLFLPVTFKQFQSLSRFEIPYIFPSQVRFIEESLRVTSRSSDSINGFR